MTKKKCEHLFIRDGFGERARERYYCQKCLMEIDVERWKNVTDIFVISDGEKVKLKR